MRKKNDITEYSFMEDILSSLTEAERVVVIDLSRKLYSSGASLSLVRSRAGCIRDIIRTNGVDNSSFLYDLYYSGIGTTKKLEIRYGADRSIIYKDKLSKRPRPDVVSHLTVDYWINKGYSEDESKRKISDIQRSNSLKRSKDSYKASSSKLRWCKEYWIGKGYSYEESVILSRDHHVKNGSLDYYIDTYGTEDGISRFKRRQKQRIDTLIHNRESHKSAGYVSKSSLKFFVPLYRKVRRLGVAREDIYFGVSGSREFFIRHSGDFNRGRFFDFAIPKINLILEYNGVYWHPRDRASWKNVFTSFDDAMSVEREKEHLCDMRGYTLLKIWEDDNLIEKMDEILQLIKSRL